MLDGVPMDEYKPEGRHYIFASAGFWLRMSSLTVIHVERVKAINSMKEHTMKIFESDLTAAAAAAAPAPAPPPSAAILEYGSDNIDGRIYYHQNIDGFSVSNK